MHIGRLDGGTGCPRGCEVGGGDHGTHDEGHRCEEPEDILYAREGVVHGGQQCAFYLNWLL